MFLPPRLFARFPFIMSGLLGRGNDSSKTPSQESGTVSNSHRLTPGYYWIRLDSLVAPFLPTWWSSRESDASVMTQPNKGKFSEGTPWCWQITLAFSEHNKPWHKRMTCTGCKKDMWLVMWPSNEPSECDKKGSGEHWHKSTQTASFPQTPFLLFNQSLKYREKKRYKKMRKGMILCVNTSGGLNFSGLFFLQNLKFNKNTTQENKIN